MCITQARSPEAPRIAARDIEYDRQSVRLLFLVQATADGTTLDRRLVENTNVGLGAAPQACESSETLQFMVRDHFPKPPGPSEMIELRRGEWFGREVEIRLFDAAGPDCVRLQLLLTEPEGTAPMTIEVRDTESPRQSR